ncbi:MAG: protecting protein DprA, partial [Frankiales bacterium]|nr:protecting protein DprA [Frankiales bacterium]
VGLGADLTAAAAVRARGYDPADDLRRAAACGARLVGPSDDEWPAHRLTWTGGGQLQPPPLSLYVRGPHRLDEAVERSVAVVGARAATSYGAHVATEMARSLAARGWTVVSGGAYGIDVAAHRGALLAEAAPTVAVLACGVDVAYPRGNDRVLGQVAQRGLVVSEVPPGSHPLRRRFLVRNRLIAALSVGTVVVEAASRSGSLATVDRARTLHRHVMAVPGSVTSAMSSGCHQQLRLGAVCVGSADEVLDQVAPVGSALALPPRGPDTARDALSDTVRRVLDAVPVRRGAGVTTLARDAGVTVLVVQQVLPPLLAHGLVERTDEGWRLTALGAGRPAPR